MSLDEMLKTRLPLNRKEAFFTATVLPAIVCYNDFAHFSEFLKLLGLDDVTVDARPETANILFFTEYSINEANAPKAVKENFPSLVFEAKDRPDLIILIEHHQEVKLIGIEAKMFSLVHPKNLKSQMDAQRLKILEPLSNLLGAKAFHFALLPKPWIDYWEENNAAALSELRASINKIVTWEDILAPFKNKGPASYWIAILETALLMPLALVHQASGRSCTRGNNADGADDLDSYAVLSIAEHMRDAGAPFRARRIGGLPRPAAFAIATGRRPMRRLRPRAAELFFDLIAAIGAVALRSPCFHLPCL